MIFHYRKGRMIKVPIVIHDEQCYMGQYHEGRLFIDLCFKSGEHIYGYTLIGFNDDGIELLDISEHVSYIDDKTPYGKLHITGVDEL